jgi:uracil-DNA glycosylase family 4
MNRATRGRDAFDQLQREIIACEACPRLRAHCTEVAAKRRPMYADWEYWGRPVPSMGHPPAPLLILGLAPAAHGANRTGRMFTGDSSGDWLYEALHRFGFANQAESRSREDGLEVRQVVITAAAHCAPPQNKPTGEELDACRSHLSRELEIVRPRLILCLGRIAYDTYLKALMAQGVELPRPRPGFAHDQVVDMPSGPPLLLSYHPSRQNTNTGRLTRAMWHSVFRHARELVDAPR